MSEQATDQERIAYPVRRSFDEPAYRVRGWGLRLTDWELWFCAFLAILAQNVSKKFGFDDWRILFNLRFNPVGWMGLGVITAYIISFLHKERPDGDIFRIIQGIGAPKYYAPRMEGGDRQWRPSPYRRVWRLRFDGSDFKASLKERLRAKRAPREARKPGRRRAALAGSSVK